MIYNFDGKVLISTARMQNHNTPFFFQAGRRASEKVVDGFVGEQRAKADSHDDCLTTFYRRCWAFTWQATGFNACCSGWPA